MAHIETPLSLKYSTAIPINSIIDYIISNHPTLLIVDKSEYWMKALQKYFAKGHAKGLKNKCPDTFECTSLDIIDPDIVLNIAQNKSDSMLLIQDYTSILSNGMYHQRAKSQELLSSFTGSKVLLYEQFFDYNTETNKNNNYINTEQCYMSTLLSEMKYLSKPFTIANRHMGITSGTTVANGDNVQVDDLVTINSIANSSNVHMISTPSWIYKKTVLSVWEK